MDIEGELAILFLLGSPVIIALILSVVWLIAKNLKHKEINNARQAYENLMREKLDVIKTAITMGYVQDDLKDLDARLEQLVGAKAMQSLLDQKAPQAPTHGEELRHTDFIRGEDELQLRNREQD